MWGMYQILHAKSLVTVALDGSVPSCPEEITQNTLEEDAFILDLKESACIIFQY